MFGLHQGNWFGALPPIALAAKAGNDVCINECMEFIENRVLRTKITKL